MEVSPPLMDVTKLLSSATPKSEATAAAAGTGVVASHDDHTHPRITWSGLATTNASGVATFDFSAKPFSAQPVAVLTVTEVGGTPQPVVLRVSAWTMSGSNYVGCQVTAQRAQTIPQNLATLLLGAVFNLFAGSASGVQVNLVLIPQSGVS